MYQSYPPGLAPHKPYRRCTKRLPNLATAGACFLTHHPTSLREELWTGKKSQHTDADPQRWADQASSRCALL